MPARLRCAAAALLLVLPAATAAAQPAARTVAAVSGRDALAVHDLATGQELARFPIAGASSDVQVTREGIAALASTAAGQILLVDLAADPPREVARLPASSLGATRPVHAYLPPEAGGRRLLVVLNDGEEARTPPGEDPADSSMLLIDATPGSAAYLRPLGELRLGRGHHKAGFSIRRARAVVSNIGDCARVLTVVDYADPAEPRAVRHFSAAEFGFDGSAPDRICDPTGRAGVALAPHGVGTSAATGAVFHFLTGTGQVAAVDAGADEPTLRWVRTSGTGGNAAKDLPGGAFMVVPQRSPREWGLRGGGGLCQVGQLAVVEASGPALAAEVPILYDGPGCTRSLADGPERFASPTYPVAAPDGRTLFLQLGTLPAPRGTAVESRWLAVFDVSDPRRPAQLPSIAVGAGNAGRDQAMTGDGRLLLVPNALDDTVSVVDVAGRRVAATFQTVPGPYRLGTFGPEGPSKPVGPAAPAPGGAR
ncbi:hypothetical protein JMJ55_28470 [Belnapia sp. T6]|uniref:Uncharacterized protein n=1 Tax=Belnapia mucosa TaxID=2804532 RepID=A0ABS1VDP1_9PROT|nr:hypothetical protein [Belnapia mucosa]MBL6459261.1 hypothetical protein [Belnapia mucosa]